MQPLLVAVEHVDLPRAVLEEQRLVDQLLPLLGGHLAPLASAAPGDPRQRPALPLRHQLLLLEELLHSTAGQGVLLQLRL